MRIALAAAPQRSAGPVELLATVGEELNGRRKAKEATQTSLQALIVKLSAHEDLPAVQEAVVDFVLEDLPATSERVHEPCWT